MDKYKKYYGLGIFLGALVLLSFLSFNLISPRLADLQSTTDLLSQKEEERAKKQDERRTVEAKIKKMQNSAATAQKKIYTPVEYDVENDTLFFTLYNDVIDLVHSNGVKIKSINYEYSPKEDSFVKSGKDYFVCDVNMELVSNYVNLGKLVENIYQYPYYVRINSLDVKPYPKDKKVLISELSLRLYANTSPKEEVVLQE